MCVLRPGICQFSPVLSPGSSVPSVSVNGLYLCAASYILFITSGNLQDSYQVSDCATGMN